MAAHWCKVASNLDSNPKIRKAGRLGREVFLFALRRNAEPSNPEPGRIPKEELAGWYVADQLQMPCDEAVTGVTAAVTAGLLIDEGDFYVISAWKDGWGKGGSDGAERTRKWRENKRVQNSVTGGDVTQCHGDGRDTDKTRLDKNRIEDPPSADTPSPGLPGLEQAIERNLGEVGLRRAKGKRPRRNSTPLPESWQPREADRAKAIDIGVNPDTEAEQFRDHHTARNSLFADWDAAFRTWLRNAVKFSNGRSQQPLAAPSPIRKEAEL